jgi:hypothetical protein
LKWVLRRTAEQTSSSICHPKHFPSSIYAIAGTAPTGANALLYTADADQKQMCNGRDSKRSIQSVQDGSCTCLSCSTTRPSKPSPKPFP